VKILIFARAPRRGTVRRALEPLLGVDGAVAVHTALLDQTAHWARALGPDGLYAAYEPADARPEMQALLGEGITCFPQAGAGIAGRFRHAVGRMFEDGVGPVLIVWPDLAQLTAAAGSDLESGVDVVIGPVFDGGLYLIGLARPLPQFFEIDETAWRGAGALGMAMTAAMQAGPEPLEVGLLRAERALHRPADVRAALADPLLPAEMARVLGRNSGFEEVDLEPEP
jgi:glycosyltransferase A (GT-A) superfamily protein (DUF2064 family)